MCVSKIRSNNVLILFFLIFLPSLCYSQSIEFNITECLIYINDEVDLDETRKVREDCKDEVVTLAFYPDTEIIELEERITGLSNDIHKFEKNKYGIYSTTTIEDDNNIDLKLSLKSFFGYIRGGEIEFSGPNPTKEAFDANQILKLKIYFSRK